MSTFWAIGHPHDAGLSASGLCHAIVSGTRRQTVWAGLGDVWKVGVTVDYQIVDNLYAKATVNYFDPDRGNDVTTGFFRLRRAF
jgi:long-subunit fatty acid transport protein